MTRSFLISSSRPSHSISNMTRRGYAVLYCTLVFLHDLAFQPIALGRAVHGLNGQHRRVRRLSLADPIGKLEIKVGNKGSLEQQLMNQEVNSRLNIAKEQALGQLKQKFPAYDAAIRMKGAYDALKRGDLSGVAQALTGISVNQKEALLASGALRGVGENLLGSLAELKKRKANTTAEAMEQEYFIRGQLDAYLIETAENKEKGPQGRAALEVFLQIFKPLVSIFMMTLNGCQPVFICKIVKIALQIAFEALYVGLTVLLGQFYEHEVWRDSLISVVKQLRKILKDAHDVTVAMEKKLMEQTNRVEGGSIELEKAEDVEKANHEAEKTLHHREEQIVNVEGSKDLQKGAEEHHYAGSEIANKLSVLKGLKGKIKPLSKEAAKIAEEARMKHIKDET